MCLKIILTIQNEIGFFCSDSVLVLFLLNVFVQFCF